MGEGKGPQQPHLKSLSSTMTHAPHCLPTDPTPSETSGTVRVGVLAKQDVRSGPLPFVYHDHPSRPSIGSLFFWKRGLLVGGPLFTPPCPPHPVSLSNVPYPAPSSKLYLLLSYFESREEAGVPGLCRPHCDDQKKRFVGVLPCTVLVLSSSPTIPLTLDPVLRGHGDPPVVGRVPKGRDDTRGGRESPE